MPLLAPHMPQKLARAAYELFAEGGFAQANVAQIAARAGVTKGSVYHHYQSKKDLILAACQHYYRSWQRQIYRELAPLTDPLDRLRAVLASSVRSCVIDRRNRVFTAEIFARSLSDADVRAGWAQFYDTVRETYIGLVAAARAAGRLDVDDPRRAVNLMLAAIEGIKQRASFESVICDPAEQEAIVNDLLALLGGREA